MGMGIWIIERSEEYLAHHGIKGQRWGIRRYQNEDGSLTEAGKIRYGENRSLTTDDQVTILRNKINKIYSTKGQKWGIHGYQNEDGTLTEEGKSIYKRCHAKNGSLTKEGIQIRNKLYDELKNNKEESDKLYSDKSYLNIKNLKKSRETYALYQDKLLENKLKEDKIVSDIFNLGLNKTNNNEIMYYTNTVDGKFYTKNELETRFKDAINNYEAAFYIENKGTKDNPRYHYYFLLN